MSDPPKPTGPHVAGSGEQMAGRDAEGGWVVPSAASSGRAATGDRSRSAGARAVPARSGSERAVVPEDFQRQRS